MTACAELSESYVAAGMAWLDLVYPGWERKIDLSTLEMMDCQNCIVGQLFGWDELVRVALGGVATAPSEYRTFLWLARHGFATPADLWLDAIKERFNSGHLSDMEVHA